MSSPPNPLDIFKLYTYHFELHAAPSWDMLKDLASKDDNAVTDSFSPNGTLLINTRKDAHQAIDDVRFIAMSEATAKSELLVPYGKLSMTVTEPNGFSFLEKLSVLRSNFQVSGAMSENLTFVLKVFFVGRLADNTIKTISSKLIPMTMLPEGTATYSELGGKYNLSFVLQSTLASTNDSGAGSAMNFAFVKRSISFGAGTVEEALSTLEKRLNEGYAEIYKKEGTSEQGRPIVYTVTHDPEIKGRVNGLNKDSYDKNEKTQFYFDSQQQIGTFVHKILKACPELQTKIGESKANLQKEGHPGIFIPVIQPRVIYYSDHVEVNLHVAINRGGMQSAYVFDYYFSDAGKNIDILSYEVKFSVIGAWTPVRISTGSDWSFNQSGLMPKENPLIYKKQIVTSDVTGQTNLVQVQRSSPEFKKNDIQIQPPNDSRNFNNVPYSSTPSLRLASDAINDFQTAISQTQTFEIRGSIDFLDAAVYYPDGSEVGNLFGGHNIWVKVNIWMLDSRFVSGKRPFYYTGYYKVLSIENIFSGGQFKQHLTVITSPEQENILR